MSVPDAATIDQMRAEAALLQTELVDVTSTTVNETSDEGDVGRGTPTTTANVAARFARTSSLGTVNEFGQQLAANAEYVVYVPVGTPIAVGSTVLRHSNTTKYVVTGVGRGGTIATATRVLVGLSEGVG